MQATTQAHYGRTHSHKRNLIHQRRKGVGVCIFIPYLCLDLCPCLCREFDKDRDKDRDKDIKYILSHLLNLIFAPQKSRGPTCL